MLDTLQVFDNGGRTADRYAVLMPDNDVLVMSERPHHPQGVCTYLGEIDGEPDRTVFGELIAFADLPAPCQERVRHDLREIYGWQGDDPTATGTFYVGFQPWVSVTVEDGRVVACDIDWSDSFRNLYTVTDGYADEDIDVPNPYEIAASRAACKYLDGKELQRRANDAVKP